MASTTRNGAPGKANRPTIGASTNSKELSAMNCKRSTKDGPFCWQNKHVLRAIRDHFDATNNVSSALAVYLALTEIASDKQSELFDRRIGDIAARAGVSYKTANKVLHRLES